jgi:hypothetical protein
MDGASALRTIAAHLAEEGWSPKRDERDGEPVIDFMHETEPHQIRLDSSDAGFVRLLKPLCSLDSPERARDVARISSVVNRSVKVAKIILVENLVFADVELFCDPADRFTQVFKRSMRSIESASRKFMKQWQESTEG